MLNKSKQNVHEIPHSGKYQALITVMLKHDVNVLALHRNLKYATASDASFIESLGNRRARSRLAGR